MISSSAVVASRRVWPNRMFGYGVLSRPAVIAVVMNLMLSGCTTERVKSADTTRSDAAATVAPNAALDDFGRPIHYDVHPRRVVSLNPTTTEAIFAIGAESRLVGRSHWDEWPLQAQAIPDLGNGIGPNVEAVVAVHPDLVVLYASEDNRAAALQLEGAGIRTLSLRIDRVADFYRGIAIIGRLLDAGASATFVADTVRRSLATVARATRELPHPSVVWPLMDATPMVVGGGSFINELLAIAGARNVYADMKQPSPLVSLEDVAVRNPDFVIRGGEGGSQSELGGAWSAVPAVAKHRVVRVPLSLVLRPSVQMGAAAAAIARALHPGTPLP